MNKNKNKIKVKTAKKKSIVIQRTKQFEISD